MTSPRYSIQKVKTWKAQVGLGYSGEIIRDGVKIGEFYNHGEGGCTLLEFWNYSTAKHQYPTRNHEEERRFNAYACSLPEKSWPDGSTTRMDADSLVSDLVGEFLTEKWLKQKCSKATLFRLEGDKIGAWRTIQRPYNDHTKATIIRQYGPRVTEVANERFRNHSGHKKEKNHGIHPQS